MRAEISISIARTRYPPPGLFRRRYRYHVHVPTTHGAANLKLLEECSDAVEIGLRDTDEEQDGAAMTRTALGKAEQTLVATRLTQVTVQDSLSVGNAATDRADPHDLR